MAAGRMSTQWGRTERRASWLLSKHPMVQRVTLETVGGWRIYRVRPWSRLPRSARAERRPGRQVRGGR